MSILRLIAVVLSMCCHAALALAMLDWTPAPRTFDEGTGNDELMIESAISIEGLISKGTAIETVTARDTEDLPAQVAQAATEEVKPVEEEIQQAITTTSETSATEVAAVEEVRPVDEPARKQEEVVEQIQQIAAVPEIAGSTVKSGGDAAAYARYKGKLWETIAKNQVAPATTRQAIVKISFKVATDGQLLSWQILSNTGTKAHEDATIKALRKSAPFPAMPVEIAGMPSEFDVDFRFGVR